MTEREMLDFVKAAVAASGTRDSVALLTETREASVRFGQNRITQNQDVFRRELKLTVGDGERQASVNSQRIDIDALPVIAGEARALLSTSSPDPEYMVPIPGGQEYPVVENAWDPETAECPAAARMEAVEKAISTAESNGYQTAGIYRMVFSQVAFCTSTGNSGFHKSTQAGFSFTMDKGRASSYRDIRGTGWKDLEIDRAVAEVASEVALDMDATELEPGEYKLILEPEATWNLLMFLPWIMDARSADEGTSVFSGMEGKKITGSQFTLSSKVNGITPGIPFDDQGLPAVDSVWIERGVVKNMPCDRYTASQTGRDPLFIPNTLDMEGGEGTVDDLISTVDRGILIRRFWYIRFVDQKTLKLTGMTRDGVFLVENGKIVKAIKDFRWNWRPLELFSKIERMGKAERRAYGSAPPIVVTGEKYPFTD